MDQVKMRCPFVAEVNIVLGNKNWRTFTSSAEYVYHKLKSRVAFVAMTRCVAPLGPIRYSPRFRGHTFKITGCVCADKIRGALELCSKFINTSLKHRVNIYFAARRNNIICMPP
jgi:hypothetical protein